jgi:hypothetical protein
MPDLSVRRAGTQRARQHRAVLTEIAAALRGKADFEIVTSTIRARTTSPRSPGRGEGRSFLNCVYCGILSQSGQSTALR